MYQLWNPPVEKHGLNLSADSIVTNHAPIKAEVPKTSVDTSTDTVEEMKKP